MQIKGIKLMQYRDNAECLLIIFIGINKVSDRALHYGLMPEKNSEFRKHITIINENIRKNQGIRDSKT